MTAIDVYQDENMVSWMKEEWDKNVKPLRPLLRFFDEKYKDTDFD